jgi:hypothetical protein
MSTGPSLKDTWPLLFGAMKDLRVAWPSRGWSWDGRLSCVTSSFSVDFEAKARAAAAAALPTEWTPATIQRAPLPLRDLAERTGGLRAGQTLYASAAIGASLAYGLWWPWGDGVTTSMRIGLSGVDPAQEPFRRLRDVFGVEA